MTKVLNFFILLLATSGFAFAGGYSSMANLTEVHSIKIEGNKITIIGSGIVESGVVTTKEHQTESDKSLGQTTQRVNMSVTRGLFVIIPYPISQRLMEFQMAGIHLRILKL